jgi:hypothetical protein
MRTRNVVLVVASLLAGIDGTALAQPLGTFTWQLQPFCSTCELNLVIPSTPSSIPAVSEGVRQLLVGKGWSDDELMKVELALDEGAEPAAGREPAQAERPRRVPHQRTHGQGRVCRRRPRSGYGTTISCSNDWALSPSALTARTRRK